MLLEHLLLMSVRVSDLNQVFFSFPLANGRVVELSDHLFADLTRLESTRFWSVETRHRRKKLTVQSQRRDHCH